MLLVDSVLSELRDELLLDNDDGVRDDKEVCVLAVDSDDELAVDALESDEYVLDDDDELSVLDELDELG